MKRKFLSVCLLLLAILTACGSPAAEQTESEIEQQILAASEPVMEEEIPMEEWENADLYQDIEEESTEKTIITLGTLLQSGDIEWLVRQFNAASDEYVAQLEYYDDLTTLATHIIAGDGPDVLFLMSVPYAQYIKRGVFLPLSDVLDGAADYEPKLREFIAAQFDDQIAVASYAFMTIWAPEYVLQGKTSWTFDEFMEIAADTNVFQKFTKKECLQEFIIHNMSEYIDVTSNTCSFDSEEFLHVLEFANQFLDDASQILNDGKGADIQFSTTLFSIGSLDTSWYETYFWHRSPAVFLGFPSNTGTGIRVDPCLALAVLASTEHEAGARELVSYALSEDFQTFLASQGPFPALHNVLRDQIRTYFSTGDYEKHSMAEDILTKVDEVWDRTTDINYRDNALYNIILEEADYYFNGAKTAEEVAALIQNRAQLYLSEQA